MTEHRHVEKQADGTPKLVTVRDCDCSEGMDQTEWLDGDVVVPLEPRQRTRHHGKVTQRDRP